MEKDKLDEFIGNCLKHELEDIKMSQEFKLNILKKAKKKTFMDKVKDLLNKEIEIPISVAGGFAALFIICFIAVLSPSNESGGFGYKDIERVRIGGGEVIFIKGEDNK